MTGGIPEQLPSRMKTKIVNNIKSQFPLQLLLETIGLPESSYYYGCAAQKRPDKYLALRNIIHKISEESKYTYGSPRIWITLRKRGIIISEKVVRKLMKEEHVVVRYARKKKSYSSYIGEISEAPKNYFKGNFNAKEPNKLWVTDITEFAVGKDKVYLSPLIDCYDGKIVGWSRSRHPDNNLVKDMLEKAIINEDIRETKHKKLHQQLTIHTDRGGHYRGVDWIEKLNCLGIRRSMSRKGNSGDNAACEGFFGRMKTEMFYDIKWNSIEELEKEIDNYMWFYNNKRIKKSLGWKSIEESRSDGIKYSKKAS